MVDPDGLRAAYKTVRADLLAECEPEGHWVGHLSSSPLSTATAISALVLAERHSCEEPEEYALSHVYEGELSQLIAAGLHWLARHQNSDGGWGDTDKSHSNIATTMLVRAAYYLTGEPASAGGMLERAEAYLQSQGHIRGLKKRYGKDKTFAVPILTNCALAGLVPWREVAALPFELACFPQSVYRWLRLPVVSYAIPAFVAIGQARFYHSKPLNPIVRRIRSAAIEPSLRILERMQPQSGGYLEAVPLTSFVVMSLASMGRADHPVVRRGVEFLLATVRGDGSWAIDADLATWNTSQAVVALAESGDEVNAHVDLQWLLDGQYGETHPLTGVRAGGWAWTDRSGGVPDVDDTSAALLALSKLEKEAPEQQSKIHDAAREGVRWLVEIQNSDGGWPTFCRGWGKLPFDRSGADLTAHALRALWAWQSKTHPEPLARRVEGALAEGVRYLADVQRSDGSWVPLWFGNQDHPEEENPIYGTARALAAYADLKLAGGSEALRGIRWLVDAQHETGGWGSGAMSSGRSRNGTEGICTVEETALAVHALLAVHAFLAVDASGEASLDAIPTLQVVIDQGLAWLVQAVESGAHTEASPIGFYFARLWYYERLYPLIHTAAALGQATRLRDCLGNRTPFQSPCNAIQNPT